MNDERLRRWRLVLGEPAQEALPGQLSSVDEQIDRALGALYDAPPSRKGSLGKSAPNVARWLGDIREFFPSPVVRVLQQDAVERLGLSQLLLEPELLEAVEPDVQLVATLLSLSSAIPARTRETARAVVRKVVEELERRLRERTVQAVRGAVRRSARLRRPRPREIDWDRTVRRNLSRWDAGRRRLIAEELIGSARRRPSLRDVVICADQSGSMAQSVVYAGIFGAVLASVRALQTRMIVFDTAVVDLTEHLADPVELLFGTQLGGGTDLQRALAYCQQVIARPAQTVLVLISDLFDGQEPARFLRRAAELHASGVQLVCLLALSDSGAPSYDEKNAEALAALGVPAFACTPELFPDLIAAAIARQDLAGWAARAGIVTARPVK